MKVTTLLLLMAFLPASCEEFFFSKKNNARYIMEVNTRELIIVLAGENSKTAYFNKAIRTTDSLKRLQENHRYSDLFFKVIKSYGKPMLQDIFINAAAVSSAVPVSDQEIINFVKGQVNESIGHAMEVIKKRIAYTNGKNTLMERIKGSDRIKIELYTEDLNRTGIYLSTYGKIEFLNVYEYEKIKGPFDQADEYLAKTMPVPDNKNDGLLADAADKVNPVIVTQSPLKTLLSKSIYDFNYFIKDTAVIGKLLRKPEVRKFFPSDLYFVWTKPFPGDTQVELIPIVVPGAYYKSVTGDFITEAHYTVDSNNGFEIDFSLNAAGAIRWKNMTRVASESDPKKRIAIVLDNLCITAPVVQGEIPNGHSTISGSFTINEARDLASILNAGAYPVGLSLLQYQAIK